MKPKLEIKRWKKQIEVKIKQIWEREWGVLYSFNPKGKKILVIDTPPPYAGPFWHIGAAIGYAMQDIVARAFRMLGFSVLYPMGLDRNGIPVEWYVEKYEGISMWETPREEFVKKCSKVLNKYCESMIKIMKDLLISADFRNVYYTDSESYRKLTQATFIQAWERGLIYEDLAPINFCPRCRTTIADNEVTHERKKSELYYIRFKVEGGDPITIATTRPELLGACGVVTFNPRDERYKNLEGKMAIVPLYGKRVRILPRSEAKPEFGTGLVMICSYGDSTDVRIFRELKLKSNVIIDEDGKLKDKLLGGMRIVEARRRIVEILKERGLIEKEETILNWVPVHDKCRTEVEILESKEFYLKQLPFLQKMKEIAEQIKWHPPHHKTKLLDWINSVTIDWPISRRRYYGTEVPLWYCKACGYVYLPNPGKYYRPWKERLEIACPECGGKEWIGEQRTLDTWFDSSVSVLFITKYMENQDFFKRVFYAIKLRPQGYDIIRTWLYYSLLRVHQLLNCNAFEHVMINGMGLDAKGRKMSKSLGNVIMPEEVIEKYGADCLRLWSALECTLGSDYRINEAKISGTKKFLTKLINVARFVSAFEAKQSRKLEVSDAWIVSEVEKLKTEVVKAYREFDFHLAAQKVYKFIWDIFSSHYLELVKRRALGGSPEAAYALNYVLREVLKLLAPIIPSTTDYLYRQLYGKSVHTEKFELKEFDPELIERGKKLMAFNRKVWKIKKESKKSLKESIEIKIPQELKDFEADLKDMHNIG